MLVLHVVSHGSHGVGVGEFCCLPVFKPLTNELRRIIRYKLRTNKAVTLDSKMVVVEFGMHIASLSVEITSNLIRGVEVSECLLVIAKEVFIRPISNFPIFNHQGVVRKFLNSSH